MNPRAASKMGLGGDYAEAFGPPTDMPKYEEHWFEIDGFRGTSRRTLTGFGDAMSPSLKIPAGSSGFGPPQGPLDTAEMALLGPRRSAEVLTRLSAPQSESIEVPRVGPPTPEEVAAVGHPDGAMSTSQPKEMGGFGFGRALNPALLEPKDTPTARTGGPIPPQLSISGSKAWGGRTPALGIHLGRPGPIRRLGSLGQWWNPISWVQTVYQGAQAVSNIASDAGDVAGDVATIANELTVLATDIPTLLQQGLFWYNTKTQQWQSYEAMIFGMLYSTYSELTTFHTDFLAAIQNLTNYLTGAGQTIENSLQSLTDIAAAMNNQLQGIQSMLSTLVGSLDNIGGELLAVFQQGTAQWAENLSEFSQNAANIQAVAALIVDDLHALRQNTDLLSTVYTEFLTTFEQEYNKPALSLPVWNAPSSSLFSLSGLGRALGVPVTQPGGGGPPGTPIYPKTGPTTASQVAQQTAQQVQAQKTAAAAPSPNAPTSAGPAPPPSPSASVGPPPEAPESETPNFTQQILSAKVASASVPAVVAQAYSTASSSPYPKSAVTTLATGLARLAKAGDVILNIGQTLLNLADFHYTSQTAILENQKAQLSQLVNIHNALEAQNASLQELLKV